MALWRVDTGEGVRLGRGPVRRGPNERTTEETVQDLREENHPPIVEFERPSGEGMLELLGCPITPSAMPWSVRRPAPWVGEHTREVLRELLPSEQIEMLDAEGLLA